MRKAGNIAYLGYSREASMVEDNSSLMGIAIDEVRDKSEGTYKIVRNLIKGNFRIRLVQNLRSRLISWFRN